MSQLSGRIALVTGVAGAIGAEITRTLLDEGATVIGADRVSGPVKPSAFVQTDLAVEHETDSLIAHILSEFGGVDLIVNNAAVSLKAPLAAIPNEEWMRVMRVNLGAPAQIIRGLATTMSEGSSIVNVSSIRATRGFADDAAYSAAKGGLESLTRALAVELAPTSRINTVAPGAIGTAMNEAVRSDPVRRGEVEARIPLGRFGEPRDVAAAVLFLLSPASAFITGATLPVDGGQSVAG